MKRKSITDLLIFIISTELIGALSGLLTGKYRFFYNQLIQPPLSPPSWLFPIVWTILYALMGISAYIIYKSPADNQKKKRAFILYGIQLFLNFIWSIVFFGFKKLGASVGIIIILLILVIWMIIVFYKISPKAAYLNLPYLIWLLFATYLNIGIFILASTT